MDAGEASTPTKLAKPASSAPEAPVTPNAPVYPDWSSSMQAFYGAGATPPFFAPTVASPSPHPYMWGGQHPLMPPYGTPVPYLYPPGGVYAHPNMATVSTAVHGTAELDRKGTEGKEIASGKKTRGTSGNDALIGSKTSDAGKVPSSSGNDAGTQSAESGSDGSSDASNDDNNQELSASKKGSFDQMIADGASGQSNGAPNFQASIPGNPVATVQATNLNISMDMWNNSPASSGAMKRRPNSTGAIAQSGIMDERWLQDERELKRQKRKQSNRESARRSRLRKQAECEELQHKVDTLNNENHALRDELQRLSEECEKLSSENHSIKEELTQLCGPEVLSRLESNHDPNRHSGRDEDVQPSINKCSQGWP